MGTSLYSGSLWRSTRVQYLYEAETYISIEGSLRSYAMGIGYSFLGVNTVKASDSNLLQFIMLRASFLHPLYSFWLCEPYQAL
jgi:hypothetical protein